MKKTISLVLMLFVALTSFAQQTDMSAYQPKLKIGEKAPDFALPVYNGEKKIALSDYAGKYVMLDFWATWCGDCRREMPIMEEALAKYEGKIEVFSVAFDRKKETLEKYLTEHPVNYSVVCDYSAWKESAVTKAYQLGWIPTFYIIAPDGTIAGSGITGEELKHTLCSLFGEAHGCGGCHKEAANAGGCGGCCGHH